MIVVTAFFWGALVIVKLPVKGTPTVLSSSTHNRVQRPRNPMCLNQMIVQMNEWWMWAVQLYHVNSQWSC